MNNLKPLKKGRGRPKADLHSKLTRKQELFVKEIVSNDGMITHREAAINAGYPASSAHTRAYEMMNPQICPHICRAIQAYRDELDEKYGITFKRHLRDLQIRHGTIDSMSKDEVLKALKELRQNEPRYAEEVIEHEDNKSDKEGSGSVRTTKESLTTIQ